MDNLTFDTPKKIDTSLAEKYIEERKSFRVNPQKGRCYVFRKGSDMKDEDLETYLSGKNEKAVSLEYIQHEQRRKFSEKLKENYELICQLEYLIRETDIEDTKNCLKLILQYLDCYDEVNNSDSLIVRLLVTEDTPLYNLGYILHHFAPISLFTTMKAAPVCHLFYELCLHARMNTNLVFINDLNVDDMKKQPKCMKRWTGPEGCVAVFTEFADIHSAVNVFLYSSPRALWRIKRILVQESVYDSVILAFSTKGRRMTTDRPRQYVEAFETRRGTVAVTLGDVEPELGVVRLETYRTVRELLALLAANPVPFLSLWCAESAQANEVAAAVPLTKYVWINGYGDFDGPPQVALAVFISGFATYLNPLFYPQTELFSSKWFTMKWQERKNIILETMDEILIFGPRSSGSPLLRLYQSIENWKPQDPVQVQSDKITIVVDNPKTNRFILQSMCREYHTNTLLPAFKFVIRGYQVVLELPSVPRMLELIQGMNKKGIPIMFITQKENISNSYIKVLIKPHSSNKKVIQTTFGTM